MMMQKDIRGISNIEYRMSNVECRSELLVEQGKYGIMIEQIFLDSVIKRFREYKTLGEKTFEQLKEEDMHFQPNEASNSIAVIIQHLHGNMLSRWTNFLTEDGEKERRKRDDEFEVHSFSKQQLVDKWNEGWMVLLSAVESLTKDDLSKTITIRSQPLNVVDAINRQLAHYGYHVGQIVYLGRWIRQGEWKSLSIPKNKSNEFNQQMQQSRH
jgi:Protein of unknown function (DUF1572)